MNINSGSTPLVLLCPAWKRWGTAAMVKSGTVILHSKADEVVPFWDSVELVKNSGLPSESLIDIGTEHRLADEESLKAMVEACERCGSVLERDKGVTTMAQQRKAWMISPGKKPTSSLPDSIKNELEAKATDLIVNVLKPKHVLPPKKDEQFNYIADIEAKWYRNYFYFFSTYARPGPNALSPTFESKFVRMEYLGNAMFALYFMRHTGELVGLYDALSVDECMKAIQDDQWFVP